MAHLDLTSIGYSLPDERPLLSVRESPAPVWDEGRVARRRS